MTPRAQRKRPTGRRKAPAKTGESATGRDGFRSLADNSPDIIDRFDRQFRHLYTNEAGARLHRIPAAQMIGKTIRETGVPDPYRSLWEKRIRKVFASAKPMDVSDTFPTPAGVRSFESRCVPEFDPQGRIQTVLVVSRDVTARKAAEDALRVAKERTESIVTGITDLYIAFDRKLRFADLNARAERDSGMKREDLIGKPLLAVLPHAKRTELYRQYRTALSTNKPVHAESVYSSLTGKWYETHVYPSKDGLTVYYKDVTERRRIEESLADERNLYKDLVNSQPAGVYRVRVTAKRRDKGDSGNALWRRFAFELTSDTFCRLLGVTQGQCRKDVGAISRRIHPEDRARFVQANADGIESLQTFKWDGRICKGKEVRWVHFTSVPRPTSNGDVVWTGIVTDITDRKRTEEALRESETRYRSLFEQAADSIVVFDPKTTRVLDFNDAACQRLGYTRDEFAKLRITDLDVIETHADVVRHSHRVMTRGHRVFETKHKTKDGTVIDAEVWPQAITLGGRTVILAIWRDIRERKRADDALRRSELRYRTLFEHALIGICEATLDGRLKIVNRAMARMFGFDAPEQMVSEVTNVARQLYAVPEDRKDIVHELQATGAVLPREVHARRRDGTSFWVEVSSRVIRDAEGQWACHHAAFVDITERKRFEAHLRAMNEKLEAKVAERTAKLRTMAIEATQAEHRERKRIACILHEDLQQRLVAMRYEVDGLRQAQKGGRASETADKLLSELADALRLTRTLTRRLTPPMLYELGLYPSLEWLAHEMGQEQGLVIRLTGRRVFRLASDDLQAFAFDAVRELLLNVSKHAGVDSAEIRIRAAGKGRIAIDVIDQGRGCAAIQEHAGSFGLFSIRERAQAMGADFTTASAPGKGTRATLILPTR